MIAKMLKPLLKTSPPRIVGSSSIKNVLASEVNIAVSANTSIGDLIVVIARCRKDRSLSFTSGWNVILEESQGNSETDIKTYIAIKTSSGETSVKIVQNASAAMSAIVLSAKCKSATAVQREAIDFTYNKRSYNSDLVLSYLCNNVGSGDLPSSSIIDKFQIVDTSYYFSTYYYYCILNHYNSTRTANVDIKINNINATSRYVIAIELY